MCSANCSPLRSLCHSDFLECALILTNTGLVRLQRELLQQGATPTVRNNFGMTPLQDALRVDADHEEVIQLLLQNPEVLADAQRTATEGYVPLRRVLTKHAALIAKTPKPQMHCAESFTLPNGNVQGAEEPQSPAGDHIPPLRLGELTTPVSSVPAAHTQLAESRFTGLSTDARMSVRADAEDDAGHEERYVDDFEEFDEVEAEPQPQPFTDQATAPQRRTPQPQSSQRRTPQPHSESEPGGGGAGAVLWGWGAAVSPGSLGQNHESSELSPPKPVPGENDMLAGVSELWRPVALPTQSFAGPKPNYGASTDQRKGPAEATLPLNIGELAGIGFDSMDQQSLPPAVAETTTQRDGQQSHASATAGMAGGIWQSVVANGGATWISTGCLAVVPCTHVSFLAP